MASPGELIAVGGNLTQFSASISYVGILRFISIVINLGTIKAGVGCLASPSTESFPTDALSCYQIASIGDTSSNITVTWLATIWVLRKAIMIRQALIAVLSRNQSFTLALSAIFVASFIVISSKKITGTGNTSIIIFSSKIPVAVLAPVTSGSIDECFAVALSGDQATFWVFLSLTNAMIPGSGLVAITRQTDMGVVDSATRILVEEGLTLFTVLSLSVMLTVIANSSGYMPASFEDSLIEVTSGGVSIAFASATLVRFTSMSRSPGQIVEEVLTAFAVQSLRIVHAFAFSSDDVYPVVLAHVDLSMCIMHSQAARSMPVARTGTTDDDLKIGRAHV